MEPTEGVNFVVHLSDLTKSDNYSSHPHQFKHLKFVVQLSERVVFPIACFISVICNMSIIGSLISMGVNRASKLRMVLAASSDILQAIALIG